MIWKSVVNILNFSEEKNIILHFSWFALFLTFLIWFSHAPLIIYIKNSFYLTDAQIKSLFIMNVALTIPARIIVGMLVDSIGPRIMYSVILIVGGALCVAFACATTYEQLAIFRFLLGFIGAGFVVGIRLVAEWFPSHQVGMAEGIYGGWGNFGSAAGALLLPTVSAFFGGDNGWRFTIISLGVFSCVYGFIFYSFVKDTPFGVGFNKTKKIGGIEVTSWSDLWILLLMNIPMYLALSLLAWRLSSLGINLLSQDTVFLIWLSLFGLFIVQTREILRVNIKRLRLGVAKEHTYDFKQVSILNFSYFVTFGSELAVVSMLPLFFIETFPKMNPVVASSLAATFAFMNIVARPSGGLMSDKIGRRLVLLLLMAGVCVGYLLLSMVNNHWCVSAVVMACMLCSFFVQAGCGAVFAMVPLIKRSLTGQIAGMTGAYGNVGGVFYLMLLSFFDYSLFFLCLAISAMIVLSICFFLKEPSVESVNETPVFVNEDKLPVLNLKST